MSYLEDKEKRLLFSALSREKEICMEIDKKCSPKQIPLAPIVENLESKFNYDRFEKEIREKAIDEFAERLSMICESNGMSINRDNGRPLYAENGVWHDLIAETVKQLKD